MKIHFVRGGGFAGLNLAVDLDTGSLVREEALEIEELVAESRFFDLPSRVVSGSIGADRFEYRIQVSSGSRRAHTVTIAEQNVPERLQPLLVRLTAMALREMHQARDAGTLDEVPPVP
jgi:hypothetical protein